MMSWNMKMSCKDSEWEKRDKYKSRWRRIIELKRFIDSKGKLRPNTDISEFESHILNEVVPTLRGAGYSSDKYSFITDLEWKILKI